MTDDQEQKIRTLLQDPNLESWVNHAKQVYEQKLDNERSTFDSREEQPREDKKKRQRETEKPQNADWSSATQKKARLPLDKKISGKALPSKRSALREFQTPPKALTEQERLQQKRKHAAEIHKKRARDPHSDSFSIFGNENEEMQESESSSDWGTCDEDVETNKRI